MGWVVNDKATWLGQEWMHAIGNKRFYRHVQMHALVMWFYRNQGGWIQVDHCKLSAKTWQRKLWVVSTITGRIGELRIVSQVIRKGSITNGAVTPVPEAPMGSSDLYIHVLLLHTLRHMHKCMCVQLEAVNIKIWGDTQPSRNLK